MKFKAYRTQNMHEQKSSPQHTRGIPMFNPKSYSTATVEKKTATTTKYGNGTKTDNGIE